MKYLRKFNESNEDHMDIIKEVMEEHITDSVENMFAIMDKNFPNYNRFI